MQNIEVNKADVAASFQQAVVDVLKDNVLLTCKKKNVKTIATVSYTHLYIINNIEREECFMLSREVAQKVLRRCLITGGDFAEIFEEDSLDNSISILNGKVENSIGGRAYGIGIRIFKGLKSVYAYTRCV